MKSNKMIKKAFISLLTFAIVFVGLIATGMTVSAEDNSTCSVCGTDYVNGFCNCEGTDSYQPVVDSDNDDYYEIGNAGQLYYFAEMIKSEDNIDANAILTADITVNEKVTENGALVSDTSNLRPWVPMYSGTPENFDWYRAHFEGNGHTISGLYCVSDMKHVGLFALTDADITNLGIVDSYFESTSEYSEYTGSIVGNADVVNLNNCYSLATVKSVSSCTGGLLGTSTPNTVINNCYFGGKIIGEGNYDALLGRTDLCYEFGNLYYASECGKASEIGEALNEEQMLSGYLAYKLNVGKNEDDAEWYQNIGEDYPAFYGKSVYASTPCHIYFTNNGADVKVSDHKFVESKGNDISVHWISVCEFCGEPEEAFEHTFGDDDSCTGCGFTHEFKTVDIYGNVEYYTKKYQFDSLEKQTVIYMLKDYSNLESLEINSPNVVFDLNGHSLDSNLFVNFGSEGTVTIKDSSSGKTGSVNGNLNVYSYVVVTGCNFNGLISVSNGSKAILHDVTVENKSIGLFSDTEDEIKIISAKFNNGFDISHYGGVEYGIEDFLMETGYITDSEGNVIEITEGQQVIEGSFSINTYVASVTIDEETKKYNDFYKAFIDASVAESAKITLLSDVDVYEYDSRVFSESNTNSNITLDLAGKSISSHVIVSYGKLIIEDSSEEQTGIINTVPGVTTLCVYNGETVINSGRLNCTVLVRTGNLTVNGGVMYNRQITVEEGTLIINNVKFEETAQIYLDFDNGNDPTVKIYGGSFASLSLLNGTLADVIPENYLPKLDSGAYVTDFSKDYITEPFTVVEHIHNYTFVANSTEHHKVCECGFIDESSRGDHTGGTATCDDVKLCEVCNFPYGDTLGHDYGEYVSLGDGTHKRVCKRDESHVETNDCHTDVLACGETAVCDLCKTEYGSPLDHDFSGDYIHIGTEHYRICQRAGCHEKSTPETCTPGTPATCTEPQICTVCLGMLEAAKGHTEGTGATCTDSAICSVCEEPYGEPLGHDYKKGVCTLCEEALPIKIVVNSYGEVYIDSLEEAFYALTYGADTVDITLLDDVTVDEDETLYAVGGKLTIDLAGYSITGFSVTVMGADVTILDSSEEKTGSVTAKSDAAFSVVMGSLTVNGGSFIGGIYSANSDQSDVSVNGGSFSGMFVGAVMINGGSFDTFKVMLSPDSSNNPVIKGGRFKNVTVMGSEGQDLSSIFPTAPCVSYVDAEGNPQNVDLTLTSYEGEFKLVHDDTHANKDSYVSDGYNHWFECENNISAFVTPHTFGDGTKCTVCDASAPFVVETSDKKLGFIDITSALEYALSESGAKLTLYDDAVYMGNLGMMMPILDISDTILTVDLNGHVLFVYAMIEVSNSTLTITDSSEEKNGRLQSIASDINANGSTVILKDLVLDEEFGIMLVASHLMIDGVTFGNQLNLEIDVKSDFAVRKAIFESGINIESESGYDVAYYFNTECMTLLDEFDEEFVFQVVVYNYPVKFTAIHDDTYLDDARLISQNGMHIKVCSECYLRADAENCSGGEASCDTGAICTVCKAEYTDALGHQYNKDGVCTVCDEKAPFTVSNGNDKWYFETISDALKKAGMLNGATVTLSANYIVNGEDEIDLYMDSVITLDLNGYSLVVDEINIYGATLVINDTSKKKTGTISFKSTLDVYEGKLVFEGGYVTDINIDLDPEYGEVALVISGGTFEDIDIDTDCDYDWIYIDIMGGVFEYMMLDIDDYAEICVNGGEFYSIESLGSYFECLDEIFVLADCTTAVDENGKRISLDFADETYYDYYFKLVHTVNMPEDIEYYTDATYHWYECDCGLMISKEKHSGGTATCEEFAICDVCEYEYGMTEPHKFDENLVCETCGEQTSGTVKIESGDYVMYTDDIEDAFRVLYYVDTAVITLLADYNAPDVYVYVEYADEVIVNLNGFKLTVGGFDVYGTELIITDESEKKNGKLILANAVHIYDGKVTLRGGNIGNLDVVFDSDAYDSELTVEGGKIEYLYVSGSYGPMYSSAGTTASDEIYGKIRIKGGTIDTLSLVYIDGIDVEITGGEFTEGIVIFAEGKNLSTLEALLPGGCYAYYSEDETKAESIMKASFVYGYVKVLHTDSYSVKQGEDSHYEECICGEIKNTEPHVYDNACDTECNVCQASRIPAEHVYDNACDANCNVCQAARVPADHVYDNACDTDCNVCQAARVPVAHVYDNACDDSCNVCGKLRGKNAHSFGETEVVEDPTRKEAGEGRVTCSECGAVEKVEIPAKGGMSAGSVVAITAGSTVATVSGTFSLLWFVIKKKKWADLVAAFK